MQKWYKGKRKVNIGERIKNFWVNGNTIDKALAVAVAISLIALGASIVKFNKKSSQESSSTKIEESVDNVSYLTNPKEPVKVLSYRKAS